MPTAPSVIVFDLDDTLYPERDYAFSGFDAVGAWFEAHFPDAGKGEAGDSFAARAKALFERGIRGKIFNEALAQYRSDWPEEFLPQMITVFREHHPHIALTPAVSALLQTLRQRGFKLGIITDGWLAAQKSKVAALGLAPLVDIIIYSDIWGREFWKPSPHPFRELEAALGVRPEQCLYIGDNPVKDMPGAHGAGWRAWRLHIPGREHSTVESPPVFAGPDFVARDWTGLEAALRALPSPVFSPRSYHR